MKAKNSIYFVSDSHLGVPDYNSSLAREKLLVKWLDEIKNNASELYLLGDIFDFWFEYSKVIPKGFSRILGKLAEISDNGIIVHYFTGNHDMWISDYFIKEFGFKIYRKPVIREINGRRLLIGHGDGLGKGDCGYKFIKKVFSNRICRWLFARIHPNTAIRIALFFSRRSRVARGDTDEIFSGREKERLIVYAENIIKSEDYDYIIFGHRHLPVDVKLNEKTRYINLGDWVTNFTYAVFENDEVMLTSFIPENSGKIVRSF